jgi:hypothetical protein
MEKDKDNLRCKILRADKIMYINVPRKPLYILMQIPYYSDNPDQITFENICLNSTVERFSKLGNDLKKNPKKLFV